MLVGHKKLYFFSLLYSFEKLLGGLGKVIEAL